MQKLHIHYFQHAPFEGLGCIEDWINQHGHTVTSTQWYATTATPDIASIGVPAYTKRNRMVSCTIYAGRGCCFPGIHFSPELPVFHWHGDTFDLPPSSTRFAATTVCANQGFICYERVIGLQFHLEVSTPDVLQMVQYGDDELVPAPYIQSAALIAQQSQLAVAGNAVMYKLLDHMAAL